MVQHRGRHLEIGLGMKDAVDERAHASRFGRKAGLEPQARGPDHEVGVDFGDDENKIGGETINQIPAIGGELMMDMRHKAGGSVEADDLLPPHQKSQQPVEAEEVVDVRVRDEDVLEAQDLARRQTRNVAEIEHERALLEQGLDIERRVAGSPVDQERVQKGSHGAGL